ncbi:hypothetical protein C9374_009386 [Naegleria lovaniensis]|uniref:SAM domain-containing protein n=1 Tax=Naegleria lovaniensis TaxID=51637 RepID=A0AA88GHZ4_NAELO|nr:uncharacterized protein C9374_009386 [Naegleria lovaniensis]KAG2377475.1 hypothetical protein C9374_009386 [Naegleria lovaniensis]
MPSQPFKSNLILDEWTKKDIELWLQFIGLGEYYKTFIKLYPTGSSLKNELVNTISSEDDIRKNACIGQLIFWFGHVRKLFQAIQHLKQNKFVFNPDSVKFETQRQENDKLTGKSSSFVSRAAPRITVIKNRDVRTLTCHEVVSMLRSDVRISNLKDETNGIFAWTRAHEEMFIAQKIDGEIFLSVTKPNEYSEFVFEKIQPNYAMATHALLFETLTKIAIEIMNNGFKPVESSLIDNQSVSSASSSSSNLNNTAVETNTISNYPDVSYAEKIQVIIGKIRASSKKVQNMSDDDLKEYADNLGTVDGIKKAYLNKEFTAIKKLFSSMRNVKKMGALSSALSSTASDYTKSECNLERLPEDIEIAERESKLLSTRFKDTIKVKLVIAEIAKNKKERTMRRLLSPIMSSISASPQFGLFHSGVIIGPWLIEWNSSSLCIPRRCYSNAATLAIDIEEISTKELDSCIDRVSQVIADWNVHNRYSQQKCNCQHFVDDICKALGIKMNFTGSMGHYITKLRNKGLCNIKWKVPVDIMEQVGIKEQKITFYTHKQLDMLMCSILSKIPDFPERYQEDHMLLKSFDRAFWLRSFKAPQNANYHAITPEEFRKYSGLKSEANVEEDDFGVFGGGEDDDENNGQSGTGGDTSSGHHSRTGCPFGHPSDKSFTADWW